MTTLTVRDGVAFSEQIRRGIEGLVKAKGVVKTDRPTSTRNR